MKTSDLPQEVMSISKMTLIIYKCLFYLTNDTFIKQQITYFLCYKRSKRVHKMQDFIEKRPQVGCIPCILTFFNINITKFTPKKLIYLINSEIQPVFNYIFINLFLGLLKFIIYPFVYIILCIKCFFFNWITINKPCSIPYFVTKISKTFKSTKLKTDIFCMRSH